jgi:hypothetical protein
MGGFIPTCHTQTPVEVAKQENVMDLGVKGIGRQTPWVLISTEL